MKTVIAIDSFKGSISSYEAGLAAKKGVLRVIPNTKISLFPIADGGEGTVAALVGGMNGKIKRVTVKNPLGKEITAEYGIIGNTAIIEMAAASGIALIKKDELNPMKTTTFGVGEMILDAVNSGCREFIIGIGGSATNDGGIGMLQSLGFEFLDEGDNEVPFGACGLGKIKKIKSEKVPKAIKDCVFKVACDVKNPLCGANGCSAVFGPQKGATQEQVKLMDSYMSHYADITKKYYPNADKEAAGSGAAGGLGFAFMTYLGAVLTKGIDLILEKIGIEEEIKSADLVITGEGRLDGQTVMGKAPIGVAALGKKHGKTVLAFSGCATREAGICNLHGIDAFFPIVRGAVSLEEAMNTENAKQNMADTVEQAIRLWNLGNKK